MRLRIAGGIAIALSIAIAGFPGASTAPAFAQSPKPATDSQTASAAPTVLATAAPQPASASSPASRTASAAGSPPDAQTVISYLSDVIRWYGHLSVEAQLVRDPDETLFFADDRQIAGEVLRLGFDYARKQAKFIAKTNPNAGAAAGSAGSSADAAGLGNITQIYQTLDAAANAIRARIKDLQARLAKAPARQRAAIASEIQESQSELDLKQERVNTLKALAQFKSGSSSPDQSGGLAAQIDELEHSISDSNAKRPAALPAESTFVARAEPTGIFGVTTELIALSNKLEALDQNSALAQALAARATGVRQSIINLIADLNARGNALSQGTGTADVATLKDRTKSFESLLEEYQLARDAALPLSKQIVLLGIYTNNVGRWHAAIEQRECLERLDALLFEIEFALRFLNFGCDRRALARRRFREPRLQILDARADRVRGGVERLIICVMLPSPVASAGEPADPAVAPAFGLVLAMNFACLRA